MIKLPAKNGNRSDKWNSLVKRMRRIEKVTDLLKMLKNSNKGLLKNQKHFFMNIVGAHSKAKKATTLNNGSKENRKHEKHS